jgi:membrane-associated phospholipid phosphatase
MDCINGEKKKITGKVLSGLLFDDKTESALDIPEDKPFLSLPSASDTLPSIRERISTFFLAFIPWLIVYETFIFIGAPKDAISTNLPLDEQLPIWEFSEVFYLFAFMFSLMVPFVIKTRKQLRSFITDIWFIIIFVGIIYTAFPLIVKQRAFIPQTFLGRLILFERSIDGESGALPSCHVIWAFLSAAYFTKSFARLKWIWYGLAVLISLSCLTTGAHSLLDVVAGFGTFMLVFYRRQIWKYLQRKISPG